MQGRSVPGPTSPQAPAGRACAGRLQALGLSSNCSTGTENFARRLLGGGGGSWGEWSGRRVAGRAWAPAVRSAR